MNKITTISIKLAICTLAIFTSNITYSLTNNDFTTYVNEEFRFSFWYPKNWKSVTTSFTETKIKVVSNNGKGVDDCNVVAITRDMFKNYTPKEYIRDAKKYFPINFRKKYPDIKFIDSGVTSLSNHDAYFTIAEVTVKSYGLSLPTTLLTIVTLESNKNNGTQYVITCRTEPERFKKMHPIFKLIMAGFVIKPSF